MGTRSQRWTVVWRDNEKPADFAEWEAMVAAAIAPYPGHFAVGFYETAEGWRFTTAWRDAADPGEGGVGAAVDPSAIRRPIYQALTKAGKPLVDDGHGRAPEAGGSPDAPSPAWDAVRGARDPEPADAGEALSDEQIDGLARIVGAGGSAALIRRLAAEVLALRRELEKLRPKP